MEAAGFSMNFETHDISSPCITGHQHLSGVMSASLDCFKGKSTGNHGFPHQIYGFPVFCSLQLIHWQLKLKMKTWNMNFLWLWPTQWHKSQRYRMLNPVTRVLAALGDHKIAAWLLLKNVRGDDNSMSYTNVRGDDDSIQCGAHEVLIWFIPRLTSSIYTFIYLLYLP